MGLRTKIILITSIFFGLISFTEAAWQEPTEIISGTWGAGNDQFGIKYEDTNDTFAGPFYLLTDGSIIIRDVINGRRKIYSNNGALTKVVKCIKSQTGEWNEECRMRGDFIQTNSEGNIWADLSKYQHPEYILYSPTGQLLKTSTTRPLELGVVSSQKIGTGLYGSIVKYPDIVYQITADQPIVKYYRDANQNLYQVETLTEGIDDDEITSYKVRKYNKCSKKISVLNLPISQYEPMPPEASDMPTWKPKPVIEYGEPLVSISGDVYAWARTKTQYKILKWTWVDDPNVPTGPEPPSGLAVTPSINGLYLTWKASPNDPGCVTKYEIARSATSGGVFTTLPPVEKGVLKYNDTTAEVGTTYYYKVRAMAGSDPSAYTSEVSGKR